MGGTFSAPATPIQNKELLDNILRQMFSKADFVDLYSLADPTKCQNYVIVGAAALEDVFFKLKIYPEKKDDGTLYFQKISSLQGKLPADLKSIQEKHCRELAFFFVRVFQIFGALFLSIYDSEFPKVDPEDRTSGTTNQINARRPFLRAADVFGAAATAAAKPKASSWFGFGGDLSSNGSFSLKYGGTNRTLQAYRHFLNKYLVVPEQGSAEFRLSGTPVRIPIDSLPPDGKIPEGANFNVKGVKYIFKRRNEAEKRDIEYTLTATLKIKQKSDKVYEVLLDEFKWDKEAPPTFSRRTDIHTDVDWRDDGFVTAVGGITQFGTVVNNMFDEVVRAMVIPSDVSTAKYLRKWNYLSSSINDTQYIKNSHVIFKGGQENNVVVNVVWKTSLRINEKSVGVEVPATLNIERQGGDSYMVTLNFADTYIRSTELREYLDIPSGPQSMLFTVYSDRTVPKSADDKTIPEFIEQTFKNTAPDDARRKERGYTFKERLGMFEPYDSTAIEPGFKVKSMWKAMVQNPPIKAHCIARASQLLSTQALYGNFKGPAFSSVCRLKFLHQTDGSLPVPNRPITTSAGISALATLFVDTLHQGSPKLTADTEKWRGFKQQMQELFELSELDVPATKQFGDIKQETFKMCDAPEVADKRIGLATDTAQKLHGVTQNLMSQQRAHVQRALALIFELFDQDELKTKRKLVFNPQLYQQGMPRVQEISNSVITLLTEYYKGCETTYQEGVKLIYSAGPASA